MFNLNAGFCAYITFTSTVQIPETVEDEYDLLGIHFFCSECPKYVQPLDGRIKYTDCKNGNRCKAGDRACEWLYQEVKAGHILTEEDEEKRVA